ncbi:acyl-CoA desaturase [Pendulispora albinea]|uniref:Fatty acid desaturase n=1 Tax=Pendulispora albinea TaxID=2741071 RepID=A0ABZ2LSL4_9BACT
MHAIEAESLEDTELDVPGDVPEAEVPEGAAPCTVSGPTALVADRVFAFLVTFLPPLAVGLALVLLGLGWYRLSAIELGLMLGMHLLCVIGVELGFHRLFSHRSYEAHRAAKVVLAVLGSMAFEGPVIWWAATHRKHHRYSDKQGDPHSPHLHPAGAWHVFRGFVHAHIGWIWVPASMRPPGWARYVTDLYRDSDLLKIQLSYFAWLAAGFVIPGAIGGALHGSWKGAFLGMLYGGPVRVFMMNHLTYWCINSVTHSRLGSRPYATSDRSSNVPLLAIPTLGQSWHNNHHAFPSASTMSHAWWQIDIGDWILRALECANLVSNRRRPAGHRMAKKKTYLPRSKMNHESDG